MTPERASEIAASLGVRYTEQPFFHGKLEQAILAACAEERHAALTEAALHVDEAAQMPGLTHDQVIAIKGVVLRVLALRDKEQP